MYFATTNSFGTGSQTRMMIDHSGNVGIGTTNPATLLHLRTGTAGEVLRVDNGGNAGWIRFDSGGTAKGYVGFGDNNSLLSVALTQSLSIRAENALHLGGNTTLTMTLVGGKVGIGTTAPSTPLHVVGDVTLTGTGNITNSGNITATGTISGGNVIAKY